jgi:flavin-dependent dehydrogenase
VFDFEDLALRGYAWDFPTLVRGEPLVCRGVYVLHDGRKHDPGEPRTKVAGYLAARGLAIEQFTLKQFAEQGFEPRAEIARPRVLLAGEAAGIDIATGEGIGQAIEYGSVAGPYLSRALARDDLGFADWRQTIEKHHLGIQLAIRYGAYRAFYSSRRASISRLVPKITHLVRVGVEDFAGVPLSKLAVVRGVGQLAAAALRR